jgi:DNA-binding NarL/FixJ family response regulator
MLERVALVGRSAELERLDERLSGLDRGAPAQVEVVGEAGIGKSALLHELCARAEERGHLALIGRAAELESDVPFGPFVDALDDYVGSVGQSMLEGLGSEGRETLAAVLPALAGPPGRPVQEVELPRLHRAVRRLLGQLASELPLVLALDDVHWADDASLELTAYLLRHPPDAAVLMAFALRPGGAPERLTSALARAAREHSLDRMDLSPLELDDVEQLLGADAGLTGIDELYRESGGNPFYLLQLARAGARTGGRARAATRGTVPAVVVEAIDEELRALAERDLTVLRAAAVAGEPFEPELVAAIAGHAEHQVLDAVGTLVERDLVRRTEVPRRFRFRHPIVRRGVYESADAGWRLAAHGRAATALAARGAPPPICAHHVERAARVGDEDAVELLAAAGQATVATAPAAAARWFEAALRLTPEAPERAGHRLGLRLGLARALAASGRLAESRAVLEQVLEELPPEAAPVRAEVISAAARIEHVLGHEGRARRLLLDTLAEQPDEQSREATQLKIALASDLFFGGDFDGMRRWAGEAVAAAASLDDPALEAAARTMLAGAEYLTARIEEARGRLGEASRLVDSLSEQELGAHLPALAWIGWCQAFLERFDEAERHLERGVAAARSTGQAHLIPLMRIGLAFACLYRGRLEDAADQLEQAVEGARVYRNDQFLAWSLGLACWAAQLRGDLHEAVRLGEEALAAAGARRDVVTVVAAAYLAEARLEAGEPRRARDDLLHAAGGPELPPIERAFKPRWYEVLTRAELSLGDHEAAAGWAQLARDAADGLELGTRSADADRAMAAVALARDDYEDAAGLARAAAEAAAGSGAPVEAAKGRALAGRALAAGGDAASAREQLARAAEESARAGAARLSDAAGEELRRLEGRSAAGGLEALSPREREVAELVTGGKTNRQVAAELVISERTVERHMENIFAKLEVRSRAAVAAAVTRARERASA